MTTLTVPLKAGAGTSIGVSDTTTNQGAGPVAASTTRFYLSANFLLDASDLLLAGARSVPALGASSASAGTTLVTIPAGTTPGTYFFFVKADGDGAVVESQEGNNISWRVVQVIAGP